MLRVGKVTGPGAVLVKARERVVVAPTSALPKLMELEVVARAGIPVPVTVAVRTLEFVGTENVPVRARRAVGLKATSTVQVPPAGTELQLVPAMMKSPEAVGCPTVMAKMEVFLRVKLCEAEVKPTG
jgi:hypothetical protein